MINELVRPQIKVNMDIEIPKLEPIKHELDKVEVFANQLSDFYTDLLDSEEFTSDIKTVKEERTKIRKVMTLVADNRKAMVKAYKEPIKDFEDTSKRIEKILKETDDKLKELVDADKLANVDPFEGLTTEIYTIAIKNKEDYDKVCEFMKKEGIVYE